ncbi:WxL protein peptidoglycan domain-containing protein [Enterococcus sp. AZ109]|uniref:DUF916 domain-containing protein n=1 Tax=Enterococcus sp. AZ109 TaxID=2774634 RepID=UPI003F2202A2
MFKKYAVLFCILIFGFLPKTALAVEIGFAAGPILPANQLDNSSYFNLLVKPGEKQKVQIQLENYDDQSKTIVVTPTTAFTNKNGQLDYSISNHTPLSGPNFREITSSPQTIRLNPKETRIVTFTLSLPQKSFSGLLLGGVHIQETTKQAEEGLQQDFSYIIGVMLREEKTLPEPELQLTQVSAVENQLAVRLKNPTGALLSRYKLTGSLEKSNDESVSLTPQTISIAPNDSFDLLLPAQSTLESGSYTLRLELDGERKFNFNKRISIDRTDGMLTISPWFPLTYLLISGLLVSLVGFIFYKRRKTHV